MERRYVEVAKTTRDYTGSTPGATEACFVATNALGAHADLAEWVLCLTHPASPRGLHTTECTRRLTSAVSTDNFSTGVFATSLL